MKYGHFNHIIHRGIKPTNILIGSDGSIKISDFGISKLMTAEEQSMTCGAGTQKFMAPEVIDECSNYDEKVDVYSFGVLLFYILSGGEMHAIKMSDKMKGKKGPIPSDFTAFAHQLINDCWNFDAKDRPSFNEMIFEMEKNNYNLIELTKPEESEVKNLIRQHKEKVRFY